MSQSLTVLKLGGALLTDKQWPFTLRQGILEQVARELRACLDAGLIERLLLVHGVGSFGHPPVMQHQLHKGLQSAGQLIHLTYAQNSVMRLRLAIAEALHEQGIAVSTILPSSCMSAAGFDLKNSFLEAIAGFLEIGMVPLLGGDVLADDQVGFCVYGGDKIAVQLALHFGASRLIFATEVDGIYDRDPVHFPAARRMDQVTLQPDTGSSAQLDAHQQVDASGAMAGKLAAVLKARRAIAEGLQVHVMSMIREGNLSALLRGQPAIGTRIVP